MFWRFEVWMMPTCLQYLNLVPRRKLCLVHQPRDVSSQSGANVHAKNAGFSDLCLCWYSSAVQFTGGLTAGLHLDVSLQGCCNGQL